MDLIHNRCELKSGGNIVGKRIRALNTMVNKLKVLEPEVDGSLFWMEVRGLVNSQCSKKLEALWHIHEWSH